MTFANGSLIRRICRVFPAVALAAALSFAMADPPALAGQSSVYPGAGISGGRGPGIPKSGSWNQGGDSHWKGNNNWNGKNKGWNGNKNWNQHYGKNWSNGYNNNWNKKWNKRARVRHWDHRPYYGQFVAGIVLGSLLTAPGVGVVPYAPEPYLCWYWADPYMYRGYWDYCYDY